MGSQEFRLHWKNHHSNLSSMFSELLSSEMMVDVTLACEGLFIKAHKIILSACSPFFKNIFLENPCKHPTIILKDMRYNELKAIVDFMYNGELVVPKDKIPSLLDVAQSLMVKGLSEFVGQENLQLDSQTKSSVHNNHKKKNKVNKRLHSTSSSTKEDVEPPSKKTSSPSSTITNSSTSISSPDADVPVDNASTSDKSTSNSEADKGPDDDGKGLLLVKVEPPDYSSINNNNNDDHKEKDNPIENNLELLFEDDTTNSQDDTNNLVCPYSEELQGQDVHDLAKIFFTRTASKRHYPLNIPGIHSPSKIPPTSGKKYPSRVCRMCPGRRETRWECAKCSVALHPQDCFEKFHNP